MANNDITWLPWAVQAFTEAQRAAATYDPDPLVPIPPAPLPLAAPLFASTGNLALVYTKERGWTTLQIAESQGLTQIDEPGGAVAGGGAKATAASYTSASSFGGGSVLGVQVPVAPAVLLPQWVGGRIGTIREPGGYRPESGGTPLFQKPIGKVENWMRVYPRDWVEES